MQALKTENLELTLDDNVVQMSVNGPMTSETVQSSFDCIENVQSEHATNDNLQICVEMQADNFSDLAEASQQFRRVGDVLRRHGSATRSTARAKAIDRKTSCRARV